MSAAPERGRANEAVVGLLAEVLSLPSRQIRVVAGHTSRRKVVEIERLTPEAVEFALARASTPAGGSASTGRER